MSQERRHLRGHDFYMDRWHRRDMLQRYVGNLRAQWMCQIDIDSCEYCHLCIDIDSCEYCHLCSEPVALIETKNVEAVSKNGTVTAKLAGRAHLDFYLLEYELAKPVQQCGTCHAPEPVDEQDITRFWVTNEDFGREEMTPKACAEWLWSLRFRHWMGECRNPRAAQMLYGGAA